MLKKFAVLLITMIMGALGCWGAMHSVAVAQKVAALNGQANVALGAGEVKKLLLLMETDSDGKISKQEFLSFMEAEFDRLDQKKEGKLDVKALTQPPPTRGFRK